MFSPIYFINIINSIINIENFRIRVNCTKVLILAIIGEVVTRGKIPFYWNLFLCIDNRTNTFLKNTIKPIDILGIQEYNTKHEMKGDMTK